MILLINLLFLCLPGGKKKSGPGSSGGSPDPTRTGPARPSRTDHRQSSSDDARTAVVTPLTPSTTAEKCMSPSTAMKVHLLLPPSTHSSSITPKIIQPFAPRPADDQLIVSHTGARDASEKKRAPYPEALPYPQDPNPVTATADQPSSRSDKSDQRKGETGDGRQLSWNEVSSGGASADWIRRHFERRGLEVPPHPTRLDVLQMEREAKERDTVQGLEEEASQQKKDEEERRRRKAKKRSRKAKKKKSKEKKKSGSCGSSGGSRATGQSATGVGEDEGLAPPEYAATKKKRKPKDKNKRRVSPTVTVDNAIADPTEQAPPESKSETGHKFASDKEKRKKPAAPKVKRPTWAEAVPESQLPDDLTDFDTSKKTSSRTKDTKDKEDSGPKIPDPTTIEKAK